MKAQNHGMKILLSISLMAFALADEVRAETAQSALLPDSQRWRSGRNYERDYELDIERENTELQRAIAKSKSELDSLKDEMSSLIDECAGFKKKQKKNKFKQCEADLERLKSEYKEVLDAFNQDKITREGKIRELQIRQRRYQERLANQQQNPCGIYTMQANPQSWSTATNLIGNQFNWTYPCQASGYPSPAYPPTYNTAGTNPLLLGQIPSGYVDPNAQPANFSGLPTYNNTVWNPNSILPAVSGSTSTGAF